MTEKTFDTLVLRLAGDSGDGIQAMGEILAKTAALSGDFFTTQPDYPAEIRAPAGTRFGVSGFQICLSGDETLTPGDRCQILLATNPAAFAKNAQDISDDGFVILNSDAFTQRNLEKALLVDTPLREMCPSSVRWLEVPMTASTLAAVSTLGLGMREADRCKNFFALGLLIWTLKKQPTVAQKWIREKFFSRPQLAEANLLALNAGYEYATRCADFPFRVSSFVPQKKAQVGLYRSINGNQAMSLGVMAAAHRLGVKMVLGSYPITPASDIMHELAKHRDFCTVFQAEDEIAAVGAALGASYGGALGVTSTSGPGLSLKSEFINLAVMTELPLVVIDVQRAGPSTGMPTKTEQADLLQALWGRHGESPIVVMAPSSVQDCFNIAIEASEIAIRSMTPVIILSDAYLANASVVWKIPEIEEADNTSMRPTTRQTPHLPYARDPVTLAREWVPPGTEGCEHRIGGLEKKADTGALCTEPENHEQMVFLRKQKVARIAGHIPQLDVLGDANAEVLVLGWGSTAGVICQAVEGLRAQGHRVARAHLRYLNPLPSNLESILRRFKKVVIPENNSGQLAFYLRGNYLVDCISILKIQGQPFYSRELQEKIIKVCETSL